MTEPELEEQEKRRGFRPVRVIVVIALILLGISGAAQWYATGVTLPRYCEKPEQILERVRKLLTERQPAGSGDRKPYIVAARLTFLVPRESQETLAHYIERLHIHIDQTCR